jgi:polyferredoxin
MQYECIGCAACIDACDQVMEDGLPEGADPLHHRERDEAPLGRKEIIGHVMRPRIMIYAGVLVAICVAFVWGLATRSTLRVDVIKDRSTLSREWRVADRQRLQPAGHEHDREAAALPCR